MTYHYSRFNTKPSLYTILKQMTLSDWCIIKPELIIIIIISILKHDLNLFISIINMSWIDSERDVPW